MPPSLGGRKTTRVLGVVFVVLALVTIWQIREMKTDLDQTQARNSTLSDNQAVLQKISGRLVEQVEDLGAQPVVDPEEIENPEEVDPEGLRGLQGFRGRPPTPEEVSVAVESYCSSGRCSQTPSASQVTSAVALYCNSRGQCQGKPGRAGEDGQDGTDGTDGQDGTDGTDGSDASDSQVASAVSAYCSVRNNCQGQQGAKGDPPGCSVNATPPGPGCKGEKGDRGDIGPQGVSVTDVACSGTDLVFTFSDGSSRPIPAPQVCLVSPPEEPPTEEP